LKLACAGLLEPRGSRLEMLKSEFNAKNFIPTDNFLNCVGISPAISSQFSPKMCTSAFFSKIAKNSLKAPFGGFKVVQGHRC